MSVISRVGTEASTESRVEETTTMRGPNGTALELFGSRSNRRGTIESMSETASRSAPVLDVAHPRMSDRRIAHAFREWLDNVDDEPVDLGVSAADELAAARAELDI